MTKNKNTDNPKPRGKYDQKLQVNASFLDVIKVIVKEPEANYQNDEQTKK